MELFSNASEFLFWTRGDGFNIALGIFLIGIILRLLEIFLLGRKTDFSEPRNNELGGAVKNLLLRSIMDKGTFKRAPLVIIVGYTWHLCFFIILLFFVPHIEFIYAMTGLKWPSLATPYIDAATIIALAAMLAMLGHRLSHPVLKFLSTYEDYLVWLVTFLPLLTGYIAFHRLTDSYPLALGMHIFMVEILMVVFPFTKLMHSFTLFIARWYSGAMMARKGVKA